MFDDVMLAIRKLRVASEGAVQKVGQVNGSLAGACPSGLPSSPPKPCVPTLSSFVCAPPHAAQVLYIDLDVHQGNGVERDKMTFKDEVGVLYCAPTCGQSRVPRFAGHSCLPAPSLRAGSKATQADAPMF